MARLHGEGIETIVFGDIFLEDLRAFREKLLAQRMEEIRRIRAGKRARE